MRQVGIVFASLAAGALLGTWFFPNAWASIEDGCEYPLADVSNGTPSPEFDKARAQGKAVIGCLDGKFAVGGITFENFSELITPEKPYAVSVDGKDFAVIHSYRCNSHNRFTQD